MTIISVKCYLNLVLAEPLGQHGVLEVSSDPSQIKCHQK